MAVLVLAVGDGGGGYGIGVEGRRPRTHCPRCGAVRAQVDFGVAGFAGGNCGGLAMRGGGESGSAAAGGGLAGPSSGADRTGGGGGEGGRAAAAFCAQPLHCGAGSLQWT